MLLLLLLLDLCLLLLHLHLLLFSLRLLEYLHLQLRRLRRGAVQQQLQAGRIELAQGSRVELGEDRGGRDRPGRQGGQVRRAVGRGLVRMELLLLLLLLLLRRELVWRWLQLQLLMLRVRSLLLELHRRLVDRPVRHGLVRMRVTATAGANQ